MHARRFVGGYGEARQRLAIIVGRGQQLLGLVVEVGQRHEHVGALAIGGVRARQAARAAIGVGQRPQIQAAEPRPHLGVGGPERQRALEQHRRTPRIGEAIGCQLRGAQIERARLRRRLARRLIGQPRGQLVEPPGRFERALERVRRARQRREQGDDRVVLAALGVELGQMAQIVGIRRAVAAQPLERRLGRAPVAGRARQRRLRAQQLGAQRRQVGERLRLDERAIDRLPRAGRRRPADRARAAPAPPTARARLLVVDRLPAVCSARAAAYGSPSRARPSAAPTLPESSASAVS